MGCSWVPSVLFDLRINYGGGNENNGDLLQRVPCMHCYTQCLQPAEGHRPPTPPLDTPGHSQASLGQSLLGSLGSWYTLDLFVPPRSLFPQSCFKFWQLSGGVNGDPLQEGLSHTQVCCTQSPTGASVHCWPRPPQETFKYSSVSVFVGSLCPGVLP